MRRARARPSSSPGMMTSVNTRSIASPEASNSKAAADDWTKKSAVAELIQQQPGDFLDFGIVLDDQNGFTPLRRIAVDNRLLAERPMASRQINRHRGAFAYLAGDRHGATRLARQAIDLRQTPSGSFVELLCRKKRLEPFGQDVCFYAAAGVGHGERDKLSAQMFRGIFRLQPNVLGLDHDRSSVRHRVAGIDDQVDQGEFQ